MRRPPVPASSPQQLAKVGFVAQDTPVYRFSVRDHLDLGARLNPGWDAGLARDRIRRLGLDPEQRASRLSGGQRAQLAITQENLDGLIMTGGTDSNPAGPVQDLRITFDQPDAWVLANHPLDAAGHARAELPSWVSACVPADAPQPAAGVRDACFQRLAAEGYHQEVIYQPGSRFWALQGLESALLLGLSAAVLAFCFWRVRRVYSPAARPIAPAPLASVDYGSGTVIWYKPRRI